MTFSRLRALLVALWGLGLMGHAIAGLLVLLALSAYVKPAEGCIADEGYYARQAIALAERDAWKLPDRTRWIDPDGKSNPQVGYTKHPLYPWVLSKAYRLLGTFGLVLPSILGAVLAGASVWLLLGAQSESWRRTGFWLVVLCSPLYVYSALIFGHALAAGIAGILFFALLRWRSGAPPGWLALALASAAALLSLRSEGTLLIVALSAALGFEAIRRPEHRRSNLAALLGFGAIFLAVSFLERAWRSSIEGAAPTWVDPASSRLGGPLIGAFKVLLGPAVSSPHWSNYLLLFSALTIPSLGRRCREGRWKAAAGFALATSAGYLAWASARQGTWVSGLILTCPVLWFGLWCRPPAPWPRDLLFLAGAGSLFVLAVCATQGAIGGGLEWGGRYLAIGLPILVLLSVSGLAPLLSLAPPRARAKIGATAVAVSLLVLATATDVLKRSHEKNRVFSELVTPLIARAEAAGNHPVNGNQPILLTNQYLLPAINWPDYERFNWIVTQYREPRYYLDRLREHRIAGFLLIEVSRTKDSFLSELASFGYEARESKAFANVSIHLVLSRSP